MSMNTSTSWQGKDWVKEDSLYYPKLRVDNKISWQRPHIIGDFHSHKLNGRVEYHSLNECFLYQYFELDPLTTRYYVQPVKVSIPSFTKKGERKDWEHVPDVLVYREGMKPVLIQVKEFEEELENDEKFHRCNRRCEIYSVEHDWTYKIIYPKTLPENILTNIKRLNGYLKRRKGYEVWEQEVIYKVKCAREITIDQLAHSFHPKADPYEIKPLIYHLVASGTFSFNVHEVIDSMTRVTMGAWTDVLEEFIFTDHDLKGGRFLESWQA
ncbi:hypothetical protein J2T13_000698 [Paenibacillus sp. DS2015]|uniref:hypothetical protein n=1 Tax=Paenibacillus sp. DS2015 TaxID=3373917 RepID=UPI003D1A11C8